MDAISLKSTLWAKPCHAIPWTVTLRVKVLAGTLNTESGVTLCSMAIAENCRTDPMQGCVQII
jgi:hypothetical protein